MKVKVESKSEFDQVATRALSAPRSAELFNFLLTWARRTEELLEGGASFSIAANYALAHANPRGRKEITIKQYVLAVEVLYHFWEHGEQLRRWHNLKFLTIAEASVANAKGALFDPSVIPAPDGKGMAVVVSTLRDYMEAHREGRLRFVKADEKGEDDGKARVGGNNHERTGDEG